MSGPVLIVLTIVGVFTSTLPAAKIPEQWQYQQEIQARNRGITELRLPPSIVDKAFPDLRDISLFCGSRAEVHSLIHVPRPEESRFLSVSNKYDLRTVALPGKYLTDPGITHSRACFSLPSSLSDLHRVRMGLGFFMPSGHHGEPKEPIIERHWMKSVM